jgi:hypothetical protein
MATATVPQGFLDQVNAVFNLKITAEASAAFADDASQALTKARNDFTTASTQAQADADALAAGRKALEALEDSYLTVGGQLPTPPATPVAPPSATPAPPITTPSTNGTPITQGA